MFAIGLFKVLLGIIGIIGTFSFLILSFFKRTRKGKLQYAAITFTTTIALIVGITLIEFLIFPEDDKTEQLVLTAYREAPLGGIWLALYNDKTWKIGYSSREITSQGTYEISSDTLTLSASEGTTIVGDVEQTSFIIGSKRTERNRTNWNCLLRNQDQ